MSAPVTLDQLLAARAAEAPGRTLYTFLDTQGEVVGEMSVDVLFARARALASALVEAGAVGQPVLMCTGPGEEQPVAMFGCFLAGAIAVPVYPPGDNAAAIGAIAGVATACGARLLLASETVGTPLAEALTARLGEAAPALVAIERASQSPVREDLPGSTPDAPAIVLYTSGSTGAPKGAVITHHGFLTNMRMLGERCGRSAEDVICSWLPHAHIAGLYTRLLALTLGARAVVVPASAFSARPPIWLEIMSRYRCTMTAAPDFAYALSAQLIPDQAAAGLDLSAWAMAVSGGEVVRPATLDRFCAKFAAAGFRPEALHPYYGLTETLCTSIPQQTGPSRLVASRAGIRLGRLRTPADEQDATTLVGNGQPLGDDTAVLAVDPETRRPVEPGLIGEIWTRGHAVTPAYYGDPERTAEGCQARLSDGSGPWFRTGDLGLVHEGQVFITGRLKELIIVRGKNHYPLDLEATAMRAIAELGVRECAAFALRQPSDEEALALAIELTDPAAHTDELVRRVRRAIASQHGLAIYRLFLLAPGSLPRTLTNKVSRARCRQLATDGGWDAALVAVVRKAADEPDPAIDLALAELSGQALRAALLAKLVALLQAGDAGTVAAEQLERPIAELGLGSIDIARVAAALRGATGLEPPFGAFFDGSSPRDLAGQLADSLEGRVPRKRPAAGWRDSVRRLVHGLPDSIPPLRTRGGNILLTGGTGFLGAWTLHSLLEDGTRTIECLVRAPNEAAGLARLIKALADGPGWDDAWRSRLIALPGDAALPRLGLDEAAWEALSDRTALVLHNAANVNFVAPYAVLAPVNVEPVHTLVALALHGGETRPIHFVSTTAVFNAANRREQRLILSCDRLDKPDFLYSGYAQTKWVAETAFRAANLSGVPLGMHRPGLIIGASTTGQSHADDFLCRLIKGCIELGYCPDADIELDLVPVDDVARGIAAAVLAPLPRSLSVCQWTAPKRVTLSELFEAFRRRGHRLTPEPLHQWLQRLRTALPPDNALFPVHPFLFEVPPGAQETVTETLDGLPLDIDPTEADAVRLAAGLHASPVDAALLDRMAAWLEARAFLPVPV